MIFEGTNANEHNPLSEEERERLIKSIEEHMKIMMVTLNIDIRDDPNSKDTPHRFAKMLINETMSGRYGPEPKITTFPNTQGYDQAIMSGPIRIESMCSHHWQPFIGEAYIAYIPDDTVVGLSKLSRIAIFYAKRPQIQEELTEQIANHVEKVLGNSKGVAVMIRSQHQCMTCRGVHDINAKMTTSALRGAFKEDPATRAEFYEMVNND
jgi:GTP cyclohydrolase I